MKPKHLLVCTFFIALIFGLWGCSKEESLEEGTKKSEVKWEVPMDEEDVPDVPVFDIETANYHITSAVLMENGVMRALTEKFFLQITTEEMDRRQSDQSMDGKSFVPKNLTERFVKDDAERITALYKRAALINFSASIDFVRTMVECEGAGEEKIDQASVDGAILGAYGLQTKGASYTSANEYEGLVPSKDYKYAAILFVPKVAVVTGEYKSITLTYHYPCVNDAGFLDGTFLMIQSDKAEDISQ